MASNISSEIRSGLNQGELQFLEDMASITRNTREEGAPRSRARTVEAIERLRQNLQNLRFRFFRDQFGAINELEEAQHRRVRETEGQQLERALKQAKLAKDLCQKVIDDYDQGPLREQLIRCCQRRTQEGKLDLSLNCWIKIEQDFRSTEHSQSEENEFADHIPVYYEYLGTKAIKQALFDDNEESRLSSALKAQAYFKYAIRYHDKGIGSKVGEFTCLNLYSVVQFVLFNVEAAVNAHEKSLECLFNRDLDDWKRPQMFRDLVKFFRRYYGDEQAFKECSRVVRTPFILSNSNLILTSCKLNESRLNYLKKFLPRLHFTSLDLSSRTLTDENLLQVGELLKEIKTPIRELVIANKKWNEPLISTEALAQFVDFIRPCNLTKIYTNTALDPVISLFTDQKEDCLRISDKLVGSADRRNFLSKIRLPANLKKVRIGREVIRQEKACVTFPKLAANFRILEIGEANQSYELSIFNLLLILWQMPNSISTINLIDIHFIYRDDDRSISYLEKFSNECQRLNQLKKVNLSGAQFSEADSSSVIGMIEGFLNAGLEELDLSDSSVNDKLMNGLYPSLSKSKVKKLSLRHTSVDSIDLCEMPMSLEVLDLSMCSYLNFEGLRIPLHHRNLTKLIISYNYLGGSVLRNLLNSSYLQKTLQVFDVSYCEPDYFLTDLAYILKSYTALKCINIAGLSQTELFKEAINDHPNQIELITS